jgi:PAS domain-containing protein
VNSARPEGVHRLLGRQSTRSTQAILHDTERLLALLFEVVTDGIAIVGVDDHVVVEANAAFCRLAGRARPDVVGSRLDELPADAHELELSGKRVALVRRSAS